MRTRRIGMTAAIGMLAGLTLAIPVLAVDIIDDPMQIDERVTQLIQASNSLCWEMNRFHQRQPNYAESYATAKEIWTRAGQLRDALRSGPVETEALLMQTNEMNGLFAQVEKDLSKWGSGDRSSLALNAGPVQRTVVTPGVDVEIPFIGVRVGGGRQVVVADDGPPQLERRRLHPNSRGSKRSLERELAALKVALNYLKEDASLPSPPNSPTAASSDGSPVPQPPKPDATVGDSSKNVPPKRSSPK